MLKTKEQRLQAYKKANKNARIAIWKKAGYTDEKGYLDYLNSTTITAPKKGGSKPKKTATSEAQDVVIAFDTTGSMRIYIASVRKHVEKLIKEMFSNTSNLKMKIVAFGDYCDMQGINNFGSAYQETQLTDNQNDLVKFVQTAKDTNGGDGDEFYELVIKKIVEETPWRENSKKSVILIADAEPHDIGYSYGTFVVNNQIDWKEEAKKAKEKGIQFDTLRIHEYSTWYKELSSITGGVCMNFANSNKISEVITASTYVRGNARAKATFAASYRSAVESGDTELIGAYKSLSSLL